MKISSRFKHWFHITYVKAGWGLLILFSLFSVARDQNLRPSLQDLYKTLAIFLSKAVQTIIYRWAATWSSRPELVLTILRLKGGSRPGTRGAAKPCPSPSIHLSPPYRPLDSKIWFKYFIKHGCRVLYLRNSEMSTLHCRPLSLTAQGCFNSDGHIGTCLFHSFCIERTFGWNFRHTAYTSLPNRLMHVL